MRLGDGFDSKPLLLACGFRSTLIMAGARSLPSGRVTFAFIDVVGSTKTFIEHGDRYVDAVTTLHATAARYVTRHGGAVVETEGDGAFLAFPTAVAALDALSGLQVEMEAATGDGLHLRIRSGAHTGHAVPVGDKYLALAVYVAARVAATANAGQLLVTDAFLAELGSSATAVDTGNYRLKDLSDPVRIWRMLGDDTLPRATPARRTNVEVPHTSFVGREGEIQELRALVAEPGLVTVVGPGGTGKTRLVSEFALADAESYAGGVWLVELATIEDPDQVVRTAGAAVGLKAPTPATIGAELERRGRSVLVIDNCEHVLDAVVDLLDDVVRAAPRITVLCTSREALALAGERVLQLSGLAARGHGTQLYLDRVADAARAETDLDLVDRLCVALDGLPLAIELAASQARSAPLAEILDAILSGQEALRRRGGEDRQRSLDAVLEWSLSRLVPGVRNSLLTLAMFPGRFTPEMARRVLEAAPRCDPEAARQLARASLIDLDGEDYRLLSTVRAAALRKLGGEPELKQEALDALTSWASTFGVERFEITQYHEDLPTDTLLAVEVALAHSLDAKILGMGKAWNLVEVASGMRVPSLGLLNLFARAATIAVADPDEVWVPVSGVNAMRWSGRVPALDPAVFGELADLARRSGDVRLIVSTLAAHAWSLELAGDYPSALACRLEQVEAAGALEARHNLGFALNGLAIHHFECGDFAASEQVQRRIVEVSRGTEMWSSWCTAQANLAELACMDGRFAEARDRALEALKEAHPIWPTRGFCLGMLAFAYLGLGERDAALETGRLSLESLREYSEKAAGFDVEEMLNKLPELRD